MSVFGVGFAIGPKVSYYSGVPKYDCFAGLFDGESRPNPSARLWIRYPQMKLSLQARLLALSLPAFFVVIAVAAVSLPSWVVAGVATIAALVVTLGMVWTLKPYHQLCRASLGQVSWPISATTEIGTVAKKSAKLEADLSQRNEQLQAALQDATSTLQTILRQPNTTPVIKVPETPWEGVAEPFAKSLTEVSQQLNQTRRRAAVLQSILNELPMAVLVFDQRKQLQLMNSVAEKWFSHLPNKGLKQSLARFLVDSEPTNNYDPDAPRAMQPHEVLNWLNGSRGGTCLATVDGPHDTPMLVEISISSVLDRKMGQGLTIILRDVTANRQSDESIRHRQRQLIGQRLSRLVAREAIPSLESIRNAATLLAQAAKQSGLRDRFVPKAQRLLDEVGRQELIAAVLGWFGRSNTTSLGEAENREIRMLDLVDDVRTKLGSAFATRNNTLVVKGDSGWLFTDEEQLNVLLTGLLLYSTSTVENTEVRMELRRRSIVQAQDEQSEILVRFPGPVPSQDLLEDIRDPFRRPYSTAFDPSGSAGFVLGLAVVQQIASHLYGQFVVESDAGHVNLRLFLPTRADKKQVANNTEQLTGVTGEGPIDALESWSMGGNSAASEASDLFDSPALSVATPAAAEHGPIPHEDSIDNWFGSSSN